MRDERDRGRSRICACRGRRRNLKPSASIRQPLLDGWGRRRASSIVEWHLDRTAFLRKGPPRGSRYFRGVDTRVRNSSEIKAFNDFATKKAGKSPESSIVARWRCW